MLEQPYERPLCILESPYAGKISRNIEFAQNVCRSLVMEGFNPYASHLFFTRFLNDEDPEERSLGIQLGFEWAKHAKVVVFAVRPGEEMSKGMKLGLLQWTAMGKTIMRREYLQTGELQLSIPLEEAP
jgi:hypothetical protein